ncbi:TetR/AcrR family transcriptional regulator [Labrys sp. ZIDIC5]|uniref:TetR/AcrR family transcriptional regulator n=1 Tax=Labrys sedimenti TaxID=3106036 RepID=UPI002ACA3843|nr:TetR/AcrR family transcriptional regulator [Labrys sp. ZIDIC5]MDZ5451855.1 TetR/AcrR family transcriptional regulator [Labrys sp. ZIDIC5]
MEHGSKSRGGRPWSFDREQAVETAMRLFWRHGYEGVSVGDLTKAIGIAPPSLYAAFGSKAGLYQEALARYEGSVGLLDFAAVAQADDLPQAVRLLLERAIEAVIHPDRERGCMISSGMVTCHPDHVSLARDLAARRENIRRDIVQALHPVAEAEALPGLARHLAAVMQGISIQARDGSSRAELQEIVEDVVAGLDRRQSRGQASR